MPNLIVPIKATYESVTRLTTLSVVKQVMKKTGLSDKVPVRFPGEIGNDVQPGSAITDGPKNLFEHHSKVKITVSEEYKDDAVINSPVRQYDAPYAFEDKALGVLIKPIFSYTATTINFEYRAATRTEVEAWRNDIKVRIADNRGSNLHELDYHYEVPQHCLTVLAHLHELRERQAAYGEDLGVWFKKCFTKRATTLAAFDGEQTLLVIGEKAIGVQGWFEFVEPTEAEKDAEGASWTVSFSYKFNYQKPVSVNFIYPLVVHNQLIDDRLFSKSRPYSLDDRPSLKTESKAAFDSVAEMYKLPNDPMGGIRTPEWDEWIPVMVPNYTVSLASWLIGVDPADPTLILDMNELGDQEMHPVFKEFLIKEQLYSTTRGRSLVYFTLYRGLEPMDDQSIYLDAELKLRTTNPMDMRQTYHVRLSACCELSLFNPRAREAIMANGCASLMIFQSLVPALDVEYAESIMLPGCRLPWSYVEWFFQMLRDRNLGGVENNTGGSHTYPDSPYYRSYYIEWPLVSILTIITAKQKAGE